MAIQLGKQSIRTLVAGCLVFGLTSVAPFAGAGIAEDGLQTYDTSSYPATPTWPAPPSWGSYPADPSWPGASSHPCCSR
jgi:hypothetical protein